MTDEGTRVPLIVSCPGRIKSGVVSDELVDFADFYPTLCEAAGIAVPAGGPVDGVSFWDTLQGKPGREKPWVYIWFEKKILVRTQTHMLKRTDPEGPDDLLDCSEPYHPVKLNREKLNDEQLQAYQALLQVIERFERDTDTPAGRTTGSAPEKEER